MPIQNTFHAENKEPVILLKQDVTEPVSSIPETDTHATESVPSKNPQYRRDPINKDALVTVLWFYVVVAIPIEGLLFSVHLAMFQENLQMGGQLYLEELPLVGWLFPGDMAASQLLVIVLAAASTFAPTLMAKAWFSRPVDFNMESFLKNKLAVAGTLAVMTLYIGIACTELLNFSIFIEAMNAPGPFASSALSPANEPSSARLFFAKVGAVLLTAITAAGGVFVANRYVKITNKINGIG